MYRVVAVDFDGTIAPYDGWRGLGMFGGPPLPGCREEMEKIKESGRTIIIFTTRGDDIEAVRQYLIEHSIPFDYINENHPGAPENISNRKVLADVYIDDRALNFSGRWDGMASRVESFSPWYAKKRQNAGCILKEMADLFALKNKEYGSSYQLVGDVFKRMFPDGISLSTSRDFNQFLLFSMIIHKAMRLRKILLSSSRDSGPNDSGPNDSARDLGVYAAMLAEEIEGEGRIE